MLLQNEIAIPSRATARRARADRSALDRLAALKTDRDLIAVAGFCAIGLLLSAIFVCFFPSLGDAGAAFGLMP